MATFLVSYDLNRPNGENAYPNLINALRADGAVKVLFSEWLVWSSGNATNVVTDVQNWAFKNIMNQTEAMKLLPK